MDRALQLMDRALKRWKPELPDLKTRPLLALPTLPPSGGAIGSRNGQVKRKAKAKR